MLTLSIVQWICGFTFGFLICILHPESRGEVRYSRVFKSSNCGTDIDSGALSDGNASLEVASEHSVSGDNGSDSDSGMSSDEIWTDSQSALPAEVERKWKEGYIKAVVSKFEFVIIILICTQNYNITINFLLCIRLRSVTLPHELRILHCLRSELHERCR